MSLSSGDHRSSSGKHPINAALRLRCPECQEGILYATPASMNRRCPKCGIRFNREPGYFSGAVWIIFMIAIPIGLGFVLGTMYLFPEMHPGLAGLTGALCFGPLVPISIRYSRSLWMYFDHQMNPQSAGGGGNDPPSHPIDPTNPVVILGRRNITTSTGETLDSIQSRRTLASSDTISTH